MPITHEFEYFKPKNLAGALKILSKYKGKARVLAGGTDLVVKLKEGLETPDAVVDIKGIKELGQLKLKNGSLFIGALVTFTDLIESEVVRKKFPLIWEAAGTVASVGVRNRATVVGNICSAVPSLDSGPVLLVHEACVLARRAGRQRRIPASKWFTGPKKTALSGNEMVTGILVPLPKKKSGGCYVKLGRYCGGDLAQAGVACFVLSGNDYKIAFCAVSPVPKRADKIEALLKGSELSDSLLRQAQELVDSEVSPITDIRSTKEYRLHMAKVMLERGIRAAVSRLAGNGPEYGESLI